MPVVEHGATIISYRHSSDLTRRRAGDADAKRAQRGVVAHVRQLNLPRPNLTFQPEELLLDALYWSLINMDGNRHVSHARVSSHLFSEPNRIFKTSGSSIDLLSL